MYDLIEYQKKFEEKLGLCANVFVVNGLNSEKKKELLLDKFSTYWGKEEIPATLYSLWGTMGLMLRNVGAMKFCNRS